MKKHEIKKTDDNDSLRKAERFAVNFLSYKSRTEKEVYDKLCSYDEFDDAEIIHVIKRLKELDLINDQKYAEQFVRMKAQNKLDGTQKIRKMLYFRGITSEIADSAIAALYTPDDDEEYDEAANAVTLIEKRVGRKKLDYDEKRRIFGYLQRKGYSFSAIYEAFKRIGHEVEGEWDNL